MKEVEVKILEVDKEKIEKKLIELGAKKVFDGISESYFFDFPTNFKIEPDEKKIYTKGQILKDVTRATRLRKEGDKITLTYKETKGKRDVIIFNQHQLVISDIDIAKNFLEAIGMQVWWIMKKHRTTYKLGEVIFDFDNHKDRYSFVPLFLEIKGPNQESVYKYVKEIGFSEKDCQSWSTSQTAEYYMQDNED